MAVCGRQGCRVRSMISNACPSSSPYAAGSARPNSGRSSRESVRRIRYAIRSSPRCIVAAFLRRGSRLSLAVPARGRTSDRHLRPDLLADFVEYVEAFWANIDAFTASIAAFREAACLDGCGHRLC